MKENPYYAEIMYMFRYFYQDRWAPQNIMKGKSRLWVKAFNDLVKQGFIEKKKDYPKHRYRWKAKFPDNY